MAIRRWNSTTSNWDVFGSPQLDITGLGITAGSIGAVNVVNGQVTTASTSLNVVRNVTLSASGPTGGNDGDVWFQYI